MWRTEQRPRQQVDVSSYRITCAVSDATWSSTHNLINSFVKKWERPHAGLVSEFGTFPVLTYLFIYLCNMFNKNIQTVPFFVNRDLFLER